MMRDSPLYAGTVFYYHLLIKKLLQSMAGQNKQRRKTKVNAGRMMAESGRHNETAKGESCNNLAVGHRLPVINRLIEMA